MCKPCLDHDSNTLTIKKKKIEDNHRNFIIDWMLDDARELSLILLNMIMALWLHKKMFIYFRDAH